MPAHCKLHNYEINCPGNGCVIVLRKDGIYVGTCIADDFDPNNITVVEEEPNGSSYTVETKISIMMNNVPLKSAAEYLNLFVPGMIDIPDAGGKPVSTKEDDIPIGKFIESIGLKLKN